MTASVDWCLSFIFVYIISVRCFPNFYMTKPSHTICFFLTFFFLLFMNLRSLYIEPLFAWTSLYSPSRFSNNNVFSVVWCALSYRQRFPVSGAVHPPPPHTQDGVLGTYFYTESTGSNQQELKPLPLASNGLTTAQPKLSRSPLPLSDVYHPSPDIWPGSPF